jgi:hypothetical protein
MPQDEDVLEPEFQQLSPDVQAMLRQGRKAQRDMEAASAAIAQLQLQAAIKDAGVPEHPAREVVFKDYDGPLDADSVKAFATKFGIVAPEKPTAEEPNAQEREAQRQILSAGGGAPAASGDVDLAVALRNAKSQAEVLAIVKQVAGTPGFHSRDGLIGVMPEY